MFNTRILKSQILVVVLSEKVKRQFLEQVENHFKVVFMFFLLYFLVLGEGEPVLQGLTPQITENILPWLTYQKFLVWFARPLQYHCCKSHLPEACVDILLCITTPCTQCFIANTHISKCKWMHSCYSIDKPTFRRQKPQQSRSNGLLSYILFELLAKANKFIGGVSMITAGSSFATVLTMTFSS